jgi:hypothetical protein
MAPPTDKHHWARWSLAAFLKEIDAVKGTYSIYIEGDERTTRLDQNFAEVRLDGPDVEEVYRDDFRLNCTLDVLISHKMDTKDLYLPERLLGQFSSGFKNIVNVFRVGNGPDDDESYLGCYILQGPIKTTKFGVINKDLRIVQATIEAPYEMQLTF